ncbi:MAG: hypothetical protein AAFO69_01375 [Bacteroidota bacterium]
MTQIIKKTATALITGFLALTMWAFTDVDTFEMTEEPPGKLEVIGYAGSERVFTFQNWKINQLQWTMRL